MRGRRGNCSQNVLKNKLKKIFKNIKFNLALSPSFIKAISQEVLDNVRKQESIY